MNANLCPIRIVAAIVMAVGLAVSAGAQTILIDLGNDSSFRGATVTNPDGNGNYWNSVWAGAFYPDILDVNGDATEVDFGFSSDGGNDSFNGPAGVTSIPPTAAEIAATDVDVVALGNLGGALEGPFDFYVSSTFQIQQLDLNKTYDLTFFGSHKYNVDNTTRYTVYTDGTFSTPVTSAELLVGVDNNHNRDTVVTISGVSPQPDRIIYVGFEGVNGELGYLNTLQVTGIPEPSCLLLAASGYGLVCFFRRRRESPESNMT